MVLEQVSLYIVLSVHISKQLHQYNPVSDIDESISAEQYESDCEIEP